MNTKALRQKILDLAIHGKLLPLEKVEQIRKDEPASVLLEKIRGEKEEKIAKGELKRNKNDSFIFTKDCEFDEDKLGKQSEGLRHKRHYEKFVDGTVKDIEDEIPFEVPEGWSWCRFSEATKNRDSERKPVNSSNRKDIKKIYDYYGATGVIDKVEEYLFDEKLLLIGEDGANLLSHTKNNAFIAEGKYWVNNHAHVIDCFDKLMLDYICHYINSLSLDEYITGSAQPKLTQKALNDLLLPLPPLAEQKLIVAEIEKIFAQIDLLEQNKTDLQTAFKQAKSKILDLAIHGKLVPQDPNDEPASVLLEKIRGEKEAKIAKGELKCNKNDSYIYKSSTDNCHYEKFTDGSEEEVEVPFELPETWSWCLFGEIAIVINGKNQSKVENPNGQYPIYGSGGIMGRADDYICPENCTIIGRKGSINNPLFVTEKFWNVDTAFGLCTNNFVLPKYLFYFCKAFDFTTIDSSTTLPSLTKTNIQQILFPLPPLNEQTRIVSKIEELFSFLDNISLNLV